MSRLLATASAIALFSAHPASAQFLSGGSAAPPNSTLNQLLWNSGGSLAGTTPSGDCTITLSTGVVICGQPWQEKQLFPASTTAAASLNVPAGTAPTSPVNGDLWTTTAGLYAQINGSTVGPFGAGGGSGTVTSVTATSPLSGGTITSTGTIALPTPLSGGSSYTAHGLLLGQGSSALTAISPVATGQVLTSQGATSDPAWATGFTVTNVAATGSVNATGSGVYQLGGSTIINPSPISSCGSLTGGTCARSVAAGNLLFFLTIGGTPTGTSLVINTVTLTNGYNCYGFDNVTPTTTFRQTAVSTTSITLSFYTLAGAPMSPASGDVLWVSCLGR